MIEALQSFEESARDFQEGGELAGPYVPRPTLLAQHTHTPHTHTHTYTHTRCTAERGVETCVCVIGSTCRTSEVSTTGFNNACVIHQHEQASS